MDEPQRIDTDDDGGFFAICLILISQISVRYQQSSSGSLSDTQKGILSINGRICRMYVALAPFQCTLMCSSGHYRKVHVAIAYCEMCPKGRSTVTKYIPSNLLLFVMIDVFHPGAIQRGPLKTPSSIHNKHFWGEDCEIRQRKFVK